MNRIAGLETEYGCLTQEHLGAHAAVTRVRNWIFQEHRYGLADVHQRDWDEPAGNGGFLFNGGRAYVDMGHLEYCTPECRQLSDLILYDRAGDRMVTKALSELGLAGEASFIRNNIDHYAGSTFGCHENYLVRRAAPLTERNVLSLLAFLTLRVLYTGAGRVGEAPGAAGHAGVSVSEEPIAFQISQRADFVHNDLFEWVQFNRAIINTRDEPLADAGLYRRLHLLHGDTSVLPETLALKVGATSLVLDLLELGVMPGIAIEDAVGTYKELSRRPDGPWVVTLSNGEEAGALDLLRCYWSLADSRFRGRDAETDWVLRRWKAALDGLEGNTEALVGRIDWVTKRWLFQRFVQSEGSSWSDPWLKAQDLEFHQADASRSLGLALAVTDVMGWFDEAALETALMAPPSDTRASARGRVLAGLKDAGNSHYFINWEGVEAEGAPTLQLLDPFERAGDRVSEWIRLLGTEGVFQPRIDADGGGPKV